jgi:glutamate synthase domain-containing protein 3
LNEQLRALVMQGARSLVVRNALGQRYIGTNLQKPVHVRIEGVPGNDLGAFMDGPTIEVMGNAQDGCGNTMNSGTLVIHGSAGDIIGHSMRGGKIFVRDNVGYRVGIHMKEYKDVRPVIVIGGTAQHCLGEYMAGGVLIVLGRNLDAGELHPSRYVGTGMHGGMILLRGEIAKYLSGQRSRIVPLTDEDQWLLQRYVGEYAGYFGLDTAELLAGDFKKLIPHTKRPYGRLYAY